MTGSAPVGGVDAHLTPLQTIAGQITDASTGLPVSTIVVHAGPALQAFGELLDSATALTDASGSYLLQGLDAGSIYVWIDGTPGYLDEVYPNVIGCCFTTPETVAMQLSAGQQVPGINMAVSRGAYVSGRVYDPDTNAAASNMLLVLFDAQGNQLLVANVDDLGHYMSHSVPTGGYYLAASTQAGLLYYPNYLCMTDTTCDLSHTQQLTFSSPQQYIVDFPIPHLDLVFHGGFEP